MIVRVNLAQRSYDIIITSQDGAGLGQLARQNASGPLAFVVTDEHVTTHAQAVADSLTAAGFRPSLAILRPGEEQKALATASELYDRLAELNADRKTLVVAVGGFVAATYARGLPLLM